MSFPAPTGAQIESAFRAFGVNFREEALRAGSWGRPWSSGLRAIVDHHTAGSNSLSYLQNAGGSYPYVQCLISKDGVAHILTWLSCWGSGDGGPWSGICAVDSLHLVAWQNEVESLGTSKDFTAAQLATLGKINAALISLGVPAANEINHEDWTDGTNGVGGYPLPTNGRKIDTLYDTPWLRQNTAKYREDDGDVAISDEDLRRIAEMVWAWKVEDPVSGDQVSERGLLNRIRQDTDATEKDTKALLARPAGGGSGGLTEHKHEPGGILP